MKVLHVGAEIFPLIKTGGLADVLGALPQALRDRAPTCALLLPGFPAHPRRRRAERAATRACCPRSARTSGRQRDAACCAQMHAAGHGLAAYVHRRALPVPPRRQPLPATARGDNAAALRAARMGGGLPGARARPGLAARHRALQRLAYGASRRVPAQMAMPGPPRRHGVHRPQPGLPGPVPARRCSRAWACPITCSASMALEFRGQVSFMKAGLQSADRITTVSPTYAREIADARVGLRPGRRAARPRCRRVGHPQRHRRTTSGDPATDGALAAALRPRCAGRQGPGQGGAAAPAGPGRASGRAAVRRRAAA